MTIAQLKLQTREAMSARLRDIPIAMRKEFSATIVEKILSLPSFGKASVIMGYVPLASEPDLAPLYDTAIEMGKTLAFPRCEANGVMHFYHIPSDWRAHITKGSLHVGEPDKSCTTILEPLEYEGVLVLVPALAYTPHRRRLGRGGGYYDRYLAKQKAYVTCVGVCFGLQVEADVPFEAHDLTVDLVVTEEIRY